MYQFVIMLIIVVAAAAEIIAAFKEHKKGAIAFSTGIAVVAGLLLFLVQNVVAERDAALQKAQLARVEHHLESGHDQRGEMQTLLEKEQLQHHETHSQLTETKVILESTESEAKNTNIALKSAEMENQKTQEKLFALREQNSGLNEKVTGLLEQNEKLKFAIDTARQEFRSMEEHLADVKTGNRLSQSDVEAIIAQARNAVEKALRQPRRQAPKMAAPHDATYKVRAGDYLKIFIQRASYKQTHMIENHGEICLPLIGGCKVEGLTRSQIETKLSELCSEAYGIREESLIDVSILIPPKRGTKLPNAYKVEPHDTLYIVMAPDFPNDRIDASESDPEQALLEEFMQGKLVEIQPDRTVLFPYIGRVELAGMKQNEIEFTIKKQMVDVHEIFKEGVPFFAAVRAK